MQSMRFQCDFCNAVEFIEASNQSEEVGFPEGWASVHVTLPYTTETSRAKINRSAIDSAIKAVPSDMVAYLKSMAPAMLDEPRQHVRVWLDACPDHQHGAVFDAATRKAAGDLNVVEGLPVKSSTSR